MIQFGPIGPGKPVALSRGDSASRIESGENVAFLLASIQFRDWQMFHGIQRISLCVRKIGEEFFPTLVGVFFFLVSYLELAHDLVYPRLFASRCSSIRKCPQSLRLACDSCLFYLEMGNRFFHFDKLVVVRVVR